jgi:hypothetical protein
VIFDTLLIDTLHFAFFAPAPKTHHSRPTAAYRRASHATAPICCMPRFRACYSLPHGLPSNWLELILRHLRGRFNSGATSTFSHFSFCPTNKQLLKCNEYFNDTVLLRINHWRMLRKGDVRRIIMMMIKRCCQLIARSASAAIDVFLYDVDRAAYHKHFRRQISLISCY